MHEYDSLIIQENEHEEVDYSLLSRNFPKDGRSYSYGAAIRYFFSENQGCKIGLCDNFFGLCVFFSLHIGLLVPCIYPAYTSSRANRSIQRKL